MKRLLQEPAVGPMAAAVPAEGLTPAVTQPERTVDLDRLLTQAKQGHEAAFAALVGRFERLVRGQILRLTGDGELAADLAQDIFLQLWRVLPAFTSAAALPGWLRRVAVNAVISHWRHEDSQRRRIVAMADAFPPREAENPVAALIEEENRDEVRAALELMPADLKNILTLRIYEKMSYEELAESLNLEVGTVRSRLFRARQLLKDTLERWQRHGRRHAHPVE